MNSDVAGFDERTVRRIIAQELCTDLIADIVGHPAGMPSLPELTYMNDGTRASVAGHLAGLIAARIVDSVSFPQGQCPADGPDTFYYLTNEARAFFDEHDLFDPTLRQPLYAQVEKPPRVQDAENLVRPKID